MTLKSTFDQIYNQGIIAHKEGKLVDAEVNFRKAVELKPDFSEVYYNLAYTQRLLGRLDEAISSYRKAIEIQPNFIEAYNNLGMILFEINRIDEAEINNRKAIQFKPDHAKSHYNLGITLFRLGKLKETVISYKKAIELKPDYAEAYNNLGVSLHQLFKVDEAESNYRKAIELKPDYADAHNNLGTLLFNFSKFNESEVSFRKAIELKPDYAEAYNNLGAIQKEFNKFEVAEEYFRKAINFKTNYIDAYINLGNLLKNFNKLDEAEEYYNKVITLKPFNEKALTGKGLISFKRGDLELSLKDFNTCNTSDSRALALTSLYALGRTDEIYQKIDKYSELDDANIYVAAFSSFIANKEKKQTAHKFCKNPMDFISISNISSYFENSNLFINEVIEELYNTKTRWEPSGKSTHKGFQSMVNLFTKPSEKIEELRVIIKKEIDLYYQKFKNDSCSFIKKWPSTYNMMAWHVVLKQLGHQNLHLHPGGWLSGTIYLKTVPDIGKNEGAIEFNLNGVKYSDVNSPKIIHQPKVGDIVLFPSSLHHRTIPFSTDTDRITISFDLMPDIKKTK